MTHMIQNCPLINYPKDAYGTIKRGNFSKPQSRQRFSRKIKSKINTLSIVKLTSTQLKKLRFNLVLKSERGQEEEEVDELEQLKKMKPRIFRNAIQDREFYELLPAVEIDSQKDVFIRSENSLPSDDELYNSTGLADAANQDEIKTEMKAEAK